MKPPSRTCLLTLSCLRVSYGCTCLLMPTSNSQLHVQYILFKSMYLVPIQVHLAFCNLNNVFSSLAASFYLSSEYNMFKQFGASIGFSREKKNRCLPPHPPPPKHTCVVRMIQMSINAWPIKLRNKLHKYSEYYEGCSNMNASSFITFFTYILRQNVMRFRKELFIAFKMAPNIKKHSLSFSSYRPL